MKIFFTIALIRLNQNSLALDLFSQSKAKKTNLMSKLKLNKNTLCNITQKTFISFV